MRSIIIKERKKTGLNLVIINQAIVILLAILRGGVITKKDVENNSLRALLFEYFATEMVLEKASYPFDEKEVISSNCGGIAESGAGKDDGGVDSISIYCDKKYLEPGESVAGIDKNVLDNYSNVDIFIVQAKSGRQGFGKGVLDSLNTFLDTINNYRSNPNTGFSESVNKCIKKIVELFEQAGSAQFHIYLGYVVENGDSGRLNSDIQTTIRTIESKNKIIDRDVEVKVLLVGNKEFEELYNRSLGIDPWHDIYLSREPYEADKNAYIAFSRLLDYYKFISDKDSGFKNNLFDSNIRDFVGSAINKNITKSLSDIKKSYPHDFWWLNNGITIICSEYKSEYGYISLRDPQIVNGMQTSRSIYGALKEASDNNFPGPSSESDYRDKNLMLRIFVDSDNNTNLRDSIISATNSQNKIQNYQIKSLEPIHRSIEEFYNIKNEGYFYERRDKYYSNQVGNKDKSIYSVQNSIEKHEDVKIIKVKSLAQCVQATVFADPRKARGSVDVLFQEKNYSNLFPSEWVGKFNNTYYVLGVFDHTIQKMIEDISYNPDNKLSFKQESKRDTYNIARKYLYFVEFYIFALWLRRENDVPDGYFKGEMGNNECANLFNFINTKGKALSVSEQGVTDALNHIYSIHSQLEGEDSGDSGLKNMTLTNKLRESVEHEW